ncbi:bifunctional 2-polyprenyl-6-hydroxyphenol methylase/3-demethylubiquinol 3-O-methyltransferase UbiG [Sediminicurvatus halobius]|uniref:Ubiquinone biosynthesis O-methyltransferase n=1 Tax=Sediminicurvatus halobius TaxID=2182432 RepID=A0A2U2N309_9GAMM|nr:bifunctional 2-polyprenyl-6-hydroxyphenol methylase/3-demethylubiquinol 3-O-methyltransferase UbiG [Spiribacter halobius]PWG63480.1 bifunctional 3-demethylubiquinol 3-O-methyltransferase/2-polyprenyl-6-hydroxyphenol methylase [Spiribacter halobius]UEX79650.1 bifunctional 2-polyprenyl-6-hydroxyphenol methylase/3-demethylubiquinol 3-O-methyltransferase UbiG [Spiribacter halobius]
MDGHSRNADPEELARFDEAASGWWDPAGDFAPLHAINPLRLDYIERRAGALAGRRVLDVGCGGGILAEGLADRGAEVTGIDLAERSLEVARLHALETGAAVTYRHVAVEALAEEAPASFDLVTCLELLEHVPDPASVVRACAALVRPGGDVVFSTLSRTPKAYLFAIVGAERVLRLLPRGTHRYSAFIRPSELGTWVRASGLELAHLQGLGYNPITRRYFLGDDVTVNYLAHCRRPDPQSP